MRIFWTDGSADPNPGPGGFAVIEETERGGVPVKIGAENPSTNIRMEAMALIAAMELAGEENCEIHTDSQFWINVMTKWAPGWESRGWKKKGGPIKNLELVKKMWGRYRTGKVRLVWEKAHIGTELNEMADQWADKGRRGEKLETTASEKAEGTVARRAGREKAEETTASRTGRESAEEAR